MSAIGTAPLPTATGTRRTLLSSCAVASAMVALGHPLPVAAADGYNATISSNVDRNGQLFRPYRANQSTINLSNTSHRAHLGADRYRHRRRIDQLPGSRLEQRTDTTNVTTFVGPSSGQNYAVLNRIIPTDQTRSITFNGTTTSVLGEAA